MSEFDKAPSLNGKIEVLSGFAFPSNGFNQLDGLPLIRIRDLGSTTTEVRFRGAYDPAYRVIKGDLLVGMDGDFEAYRWEGDDALLNQRVCKISSASKEINQGFLYWYLKPKISEVHRKTPQTTVRHLSTKDIYAIAEPPVDFIEQEVIAQVLDTLDTAIRETEALIDKLKAVKQGLLHDLLTRGIDANGQLRPPQSEAPQLYKESPLGWIPREWEVEPIISLTSNSVIGPFGSDLVAADYRDSGVPVIFVRDVKPDQLVWKSNVFVTTNKALALAAHEVHAGDVVATKMGLPPCVAAVYPESMSSGIVTADIVRLRPCTDRICPDWMSIFMNSPAVAKQVEQITAGVTRPKVTLRDVRNLLIGLPSIKEQERILDRLVAVQSRIQLEETSREKLIAEKSGLMDDLLTGRVRVTPLLKSLQQTAAQTGA